MAIAGSMDFYIEMVRMRERLGTMGIRTLIPDGHEFYASFDSAKVFEAYKRQISMHYLDQIRHWITSSLFVLNFDRHGIRSYIGPSTFAEIAVAAVHRKRIYVISDYPDQYEDELRAWEVVPLYGRLDQLVHDYEETIGGWQPCQKQLIFPGF
ncbi:MAG TPA: hypothetical protein VMF67_14000 [Rhizomicrobium sp.]|nr:hypothetical protein [Rhizomicrobium sp.]